MENGIQYLKTEKYTPKQINNPNLNLRFEPVSPSSAISGYQRSYRPEQSKQENQGENQEEPVVQQVSSQETAAKTDQIKDSSATQEPTSEETTETISRKKGKRYNNRQDFIQDITEAYTKALTSRGINPDYAKMLVAQDALESNWGQSSLAEEFNFGGIKAKEGTPFIEKETNEYSDKKGNYKTRAKFRRFNNLEEYANYKIDLLNGKRYQAFVGDPSQFYNRIKAGGYATDPSYVPKVTSIYNSLVLSAKQGGSIPSRISLLVSQFNKQFNK